MNAAAHISVGAAIAAPTSYAATRLAIRAAWATNFLDRPLGYKGHARPTPYLGGAAVIAAVVTASLIAGVERSHLAPLLWCAGALWLVGTIDDRRTLSPQVRLLAELIAAIVVSASGLGWHVIGWAPGDYALTAIWVVALVNAVNLMDNLDGAAASVTTASAVGIAAIGWAEGHVGVAVIAAAVAAGCAGYLPHNLAKPARIFLGDGGSMPLGFLLATLAIGTVDQADGAATLMTGGLLVGLPILDTALVIVSRTRRGVSVVTAGRDHLTHRLLTRLRTPRRVAATLGSVQLLIAMLALTSQESGRSALIVSGAVAVFVGIWLISVLDSAPWRVDAPAQQHRSVSAPRTRRFVRRVALPAAESAGAPTEQQAALETQ